MAALAAAAVRDKRRRQATAESSATGGRRSRLDLEAPSIGGDILESRRSSADWHNYREGLIREQEVRFFV